SGARFDERERLQCLHRRTRIHRAIDVAEREHNAAVGVDNGNRAAVAALHQRAAQHLNKNVIGHWLRTSTRETGLQDCRTLMCDITAPRFAWRGGNRHIRVPNPRSIPSMRRPLRKVLTGILALFLFPLAVHAALYATKDHPASFRDANWASVGMLPAASADKDARLLVFSGRTGRWKGIFSVHSWIVFKP